MWGGYMLINSDCTIYTRKRTPSSDHDKWERQYVPECWWFEQTKSSITTEGLKAADILTLRIPDLSIKVKKDDVVVKGDCSLEIQTIKDLIGYRYFKVITANYNTFGDEPHIRVEAV